VSDIATQPTMSQRARRRALMAAVYYEQIGAWADTAGIVRFTVQVTDNTGQTASRALSITVEEPDAR
jgi:hypothetical protein